MLLEMLFLPSPRAATPENPRFNLNDPQAWDSLLTGEPSSSGIRVTRETALSFSPWWRGVSLLSADVAKLPLNVYSVAGDTKSIDKTHPAYRVLRRQANEYQTAYQFKRQLTAHAIQSGNGYAYIDRNGGADVKALLPLSPDNVTPVRENGVLKYVLEINAEKRKIDAEDILHIKGFGYDGLMGYAVYEKAREDLGAGIAQRKYGAVFFRNNARPNVIIQVPTRLDEKQIQSLREGWERIQGGLENAHRVAILQGGATAVPLSLSASESQLIESRQLSIRDIANYLGIPPHKLGDTTRTSYGSLEQENQDYLDSGLDPWLCCWEDECHAKLLSEAEKDSESHEFQFDTKRLLRANLAARGTYYATATGQRAWMTPDEVRVEEGLDPLGGESADLKDPLNMSSKDGGADGQQDDGSGESPKKKIGALAQLAYDPDQPRDENGRFGEGGYDSDAEDEKHNDRQEAERNSLGEKHEKEEAKVEKDREAEDKAVEDRRETEDNAAVDRIETRDKEDEATSDKREQEGSQLIGARDKEEDARNAGYATEDKAVDDRHEKEQAEFTEKWEKDGGLHDQIRQEKGEDVAAREYGNAQEKLDEQQEDEKEKIEEKRDKEHEKAEKTRDKEDAIIEKARDKEDKAVEKQRDKEDGEYQKSFDKRDREDAQLQKARDKEDDERWAKQNKEEAEMNERHEKEDEEHEKNKKAIEKSIDRHQRRHGEGALLESVP